MNVRTAINLWCPDWSAARKRKALPGRVGDVRVNFEGKLRTTLGGAFVLYECIAAPETAFIELHPKLLLEDEIHIRLVLLHEVAHLRAHPINGHGRLWKSWAENFGTPAVAHYPYGDMLRHVPLPKERK